MGERLTCGFYSENDTNFAFGTNYGTLYIASLKTIGRNRVEASYCKVDGICKQNNFLEKKGGSAKELNIDLMNEADNQSLDIERQNSEQDTDCFTGITSINFPYVDPIGTMLVAFDDGTIKLWQSAVKNEQLMKILELQQAGKKKNANQPVIYDISEVGYQQFDLVDSFDIFANPHGLEEVTEFDRTQLKSLYAVSV